MGILYHDADTVQEESNSVAIDILIQQSVPMFVIRSSKPSRSSKRARRSTWRNLPLYLSLSDLSNDPDIVRLLSPPISYISTIQHRDSITPDVNTLQSLPPPSAFKESLHGSIHLLDNTVSISSPSILELNAGDWTFIDTEQHTPQISTPSSEPETWILLSDDS